MDPDYSPPPPAYSEEEFDRKTVQATELSLLTPSPRVDEDGWERYNPHTFTDNSGKIHSGQYGKIAANPPPLPKVLPLRIEKKLHSDYTSAHSDSIFSGGKPSYHTSTFSSEEGYASTSSTPTSDCFDSRYSSNSSTVDGHTTRIHSSKPTGFSLRDGTDDYSYDPYREYPSTPQPPQSTRQSLPTAPRYQSDTHSTTRYSHSPNISQSRPPTFTVPRIDFNPAVAYGRTAPTSTVRRLPTPNAANQHTLNTSHDPNAFYNSSVSAQLKPIIPSSPRPTQISHPTRPSQQSLLFSNHDFMNSRHLVASESSVQPAWQNSLTPLRPMHSYSGMSSSSRTVNSDAMSLYSTSSSTYDVDYGRQGSNWYPNS